MYVLLPERTDGNVSGHQGAYPEVVWAKTGQDGGVKATRGPHVNVMIMGRAPGRRYHFHSINCPTEMMLCLVLFRAGANTFHLMFNERIGAGADLVWMHLKDLLFYTIV